MCGSLKAAIACAIASKWEIDAAFQVFDIVLGLCFSIGHNTCGGVVWNQKLVRPFGGVITLLSRTGWARCVETIAREPQVATARVLNVDSFPSVVASVAVVGWDLIRQLHRRAKAHQLIVAVFDAYVAVP